MKLWSTWTVTFFKTSSNAFLIKGNLAAGLCFGYPTSGNYWGREGRPDYRLEVGFSFSWKNGQFNCEFNRNSLDEAPAGWQRETFGSCDSGDSCSPGQTYQQKNKWAESCKQLRNEVPWEPLAAQRRLPDSPASSGPGEIEITQAGSPPQGHRWVGGTHKQIISQVIFHCVQDPQSWRTRCYPALGVGKGQSSGGLKAEVFSRQQRKGKDVPVGGKGLPGSPEVHGTFEGLKEGSHD